MATSLRDKIIILDLMDYSPGFLFEAREGSEGLILLVGSGWTITPVVRKMADLIIYQSILPPDEDVLNAPGGDLIYGIENIILGPEYSNGTAEKERDVCVYIGGGISSYYARKIRNELASWGIFAPLYTANDTGSLYRIQATSRIQVCTMGMAVYEGMAVGAVPLMISRSADHEMTAEEIQRRRCGRSLGLADEINPAVVGDFCRRMLEHPADLDELSKNGEGLVDGRGLYRVADAILSRQ